MCGGQESRRFRSQLIKLAGGDAAEQTSDNFLSHDRGVYTSEVMPTMLFAGAQVLNPARDFVKMHGLFAAIPLDDKHDNFCVATRSLIFCTIASLLLFVLCCKKSPYPLLVPQSSTRLQIRHTPCEHPGLHSVGWHAVAVCQTVFGDCLLCYVPEIWNDFLNF